MTITIKPQSNHSEILQEELRAEIRKSLPESQYFLNTSNPDNEKGLFAEIGISILTELAAKLFGKLLDSFTKKYGVEIVIEAPDGGRITVSYTGAELPELEQFLIAGVKK